MYAVGLGYAPYWLEERSPLLIHLHSSKMQQSAHPVIVDLNESDTSTLGSVSRKFIDKNLVIFRYSRAFPSPVVRLFTTAGRVEFALRTASEAQLLTAKRTMQTNP